MPRLFTAVKLPESLTPVVAELEAQLPSTHLKLVRADIAHITLKFIGEVLEEELPRIVQALSGVRMGRFEATLKGVGAFPSAKKPRVVWMGCEGEFAPLFEQVENALFSVGVKRETRQFHAHLTLARVKRLTGEDAALLESLIERHESTHFGEFGVNEFVLVQSTLTPEGPIYRELERFPLEG
ncbi:MAG: RNA 2',3'-cyclic phosphodiesterase [Methermicoccaceae archaeon]